MKQYLSYSEMRLFFQDRVEYQRRYLEGIEGEQNPAMKLGTLIHKTIEEPRYPWLKEAREMEIRGRRLLALRKLITKAMDKRPPEGEVSMIATTRTGIKLFAIYDGLDRKNKVLYEYKTSDRPELWNQRIVDDHKQLSFYSYMYHLNTHGFFKEINLYYLNTAKGTIKHFRTARGPRDIEFIEGMVENCVSKLKELGWWEKRLSKEDKAKKFNLTLFPNVT